MQLKNRLEEALKQALKGQDRFAVGVLRLVLNSLKNFEIEKRQPLSEEEAMRILQKEAKQRQESIMSYKQANRMDLVDQESRELALIETFLPEPLSETELTQIIDTVMAELKPTGPQDMGKVMSAVSQQTGGRADGGRVAAIVRERLQAQS